MRKQYPNLLGSFKDPKTEGKLITVACKQDTKKKKSFFLVYSGNKRLELDKNGLKNNIGSIFLSPSITNVALLG